MRREAHGGIRRGWDPEACPPALQQPHPTHQADVTSAHMGLTRHHPGPSFQKNGLVSETQRWQISLENGHSRSDDVIPVFLSHHGLLFFLDK